MPGFFMSTRSGKCFAQAEKLKNRSAVNAKQFITVPVSIHCNCAIKAVVIAAYMYLLGQSTYGQYS
jgi:hypothetical protein